jgi:hypothetical protein
MSWKNKLTDVLILYIKTQGIEVTNNPHDIYKAILSIPPLKKMGMWRSIA